MRCLVSLRYISCGMFTIVIALLVPRLLTPIPWVLLPLNLSNRVVNPISDHPVLSSKGPSKSRNEATLSLAAWCSEPSTQQSHNDNS